MWSTHPTFLTMNCLVKIGFSSTILQSSCIVQVGIAIAERVDIRFMLISTKKHTRAGHSFLPPSSPHPPLPFLSFPVPTYVSVQIGR